MGKNHKSVESYFESARKYKTPLSEGKARSLIEKRGTSTGHSFFTNKGIKIMTIIMSIIVTSLIGYFGITEFAGDPVDAQMKIPANENVEATSADDGAEIENKSTVQEKNADNNRNESQNTATDENQAGASIHDKTDKSEDKILGMNRIVLDEEEMEEMGLFYDMAERDGKQVPTICYWEDFNDKNDNLHIYAKNFSTHRFEKIPESNSKIQISPILLTNFDGTRRMNSTFLGGENEQLEKMIPFHRELMWLYNVELDKDNLPVEVPEEIKNALKELAEQIEIYQSSAHNRVINDRIKESINKIKKHFKKYEYDPEKFKKIVGSDPDAPVEMILFEDEINDSILEKYQKIAKKLGANIRLSTQPVNIKTYMKENFPELEEYLSKLHDQIENYVLINQMIAVEVPYKDDPDDGLIFWYRPSRELIKYLPGRVRDDLALEIELLEE